MTFLRPDFWKKYWIILVILVATTVLHYSHETHLHELHGVYKLFFFIPIILGGFRGGLLGGVLVSVLVILAFIPHAFWAMCSACGSNLDKSVEMALYLGVGLLTGTLSHRLTGARNQLQHTLDEKTAMEAELMRSTRMAAVGQLSAGLAHEIRNPLASIQGAAEVLTDDYDQSQPKGRMLTILLGEARRLNSVLSRFLEFARTEPGERSTFDMLAESHTVAEMLRHHPDFPDLKCQVGSDLETVPTLGNAEQIRQVLLNLGLNAAAASGQGGTVEFRLDMTAGNCRCQVIDTGPGFDDEALENFGTPFFSTREQGTGLGLATSLKIIQDLGGRLTPGRSESGGGQVTLTLPAG